MLLTTVGLTQTDPRKKYFDDPTMQVMRHVDWLVFTKRGYSFWKHLVPFMVAALVLIIVSVPNDNLLVKLANRLQQPSWLWLPAGLLTLVATSVYVTSLSIQIRRAYVFKDGRWRRTIVTAAVYVLICTTMAYVVLRSAAPYQKSWGASWACLLLAVLSLTGIGWSGPSSWIESIGLQCPDYTEPQEAAFKVTKLLNLMRGKQIGEQRDVLDFLEGINNLRTGIEKYLRYESDWAERDLSPVLAKLRTLSESVELKFPDSNPNAIRDFAVACRCQKTPQYEEFINALKDVGKHWEVWKCPEE